MNDVTKIVLVYILEEEEQNEQIINIFFLRKNKWIKVHNIFTAKRDEETFENVIKKNLIVGECKF
jgi:hypothetical protein